MASMTLYPPIVNDYMPAFQVKSDETRSAEDKNECPIIFSLSKFNSSSDIKQIQISITKQDTGLNMLKTTDTIVPEEDESWITDSRYRATGILLLDIDSLTEITENIYSINIFADDLAAAGVEFDELIHYSGFIPGWIYKVQMRFSTKQYGLERDTKGQSEWLKENAQFFSEWSTVCVVKPIGDIQLNLIELGYSVVNPASRTASVINYESSNLTITGNIVSIDETETLYSYRFKLYDSLNNLLEDSDILLAQNYSNINKMYYMFSFELSNNQNYYLEVSYNTNNDFNNTTLIEFTCQYNVGLGKDIYVAYLETEAESNIKALTSLGFEEDEGRIGLLLVNNESNPFDGIIYIRRTDSKSNFTKWEDIKEISCIGGVLPEDIFYDYTIESGIWYQYAIQILLSDQTYRSALIFPYKMNEGVKEILDEEYIMRDFNYSFLLGEDNQQLKLKFDNTMGNFKIQVTDSKTETIGGRYPTTARNAAVYYKIFPINGLISFQMDENKLFCSEDDIYKNNKVRALYEQYRKDRGVGQYDYVYEKEFRNKVLEFLHNGKVKLFKSPTEGNVIVRLTDVNLTPNQTLGRMVYSFTSNASEVAEDNIDNYIKYKFLDKYELGSGTAISIGHNHDTADANDSPYPRFW